MNETTKMHHVRKVRGDFENFLHGEGIDIGAGPDPLRVLDGKVRAWDVADGDAQIMDSEENETYDFVYSSHCLEHLRDVGQALNNWVHILKPNGHLYFVVPDYILYEKMCWPSMYNPDHKQSFSCNIKRVAVNRSNHWHIQDDLAPLIESLGVDILRVELEDMGFNYNHGITDQTMYGAVAQICIVGRKIEQEYTYQSQFRRNLVREE